MRFRTQQAEEYFVFRNRQSQSMALQLVAHLPRSPPAWESENMKIPDLPESPLEIVPSLSWPPLMATSILSDGH